MKNFKAIVIVFTLAVKTAINRKKLVNNRINYHF